MSARKPVRRRLRADGSPRIVVDFFYKDTHGARKRYRRDSDAPTMDAAREEAKRLMDLAARTGSPYPSAPPTTFAEFVDGAFASAYMPTYRPETAERYRGLLRHRLRGVFGATPLRDIQTAQLRLFVSALATDGVQARGPLNLVRTILTAAHESNLIEAVPKFPRVSSSEGVADAPPDEDVAALIDGPRDWLRIAVALAAYAGLRSGEVRALEWRDVDLRRGVLTVRHSISLNKVVKPKSDKHRVVPIADPLRVILADAFATQKARGRVILTRAGTSPSRQAVLTRLKKLEARLGLATWSFHHLRHYFVSTLVRRGASLRAVQDLAGHGTIRTTEGYTHATRDDLTSAIGLLQ